MTSAPVEFVPPAAFGAIGPDGRTVAATQWNRVHVWDAEGKKYLDLTAAFGVAAAGHANPHVVQAGQKGISVFGRHDPSELQRLVTERVTMKRPTER